MPEIKDSQELHQEDIESYILSQLEKEMKEDEIMKEKLVQSWKNNKIQLMESKLNMLQQLEKEKHDFISKDENITEENFANWKRKYNHMETYVHHCFENFQRQLNNKESDDIPMILNWFHSWLLLIDILFNQWV